MTAWILAFHIIFMVAWFAGLFYLPRLFIYHTMATDEISQTRFKVMERKLFWMITTPAGILATICGEWLYWSNWRTYIHLDWMHAKLALVVVLWSYHIFCGYLLQQFRYDKNRLSTQFYRFFNEVPTVLLFAIVILVVVKP